MTTKRFTLRYIHEQHISANLYDCGTFIASISIGAELIVELLNNLSEDNEQLRQENEQLHEENQELKKKVKTMAKELCNCEEDYIYEEW